MIYVIMHVNYEYYLKAINLFLNFSLSLSLERLALIMRIALILYAQENIVGIIKGKIVGNCLVDYI